MYLIKAVSVRVFKTGREHIQTGPYVHILFACVLVVVGVFVEENGKQKQEKNTTQFKSFLPYKSAPVCVSVWDGEREKWTRKKARTTQNRENRRPRKWTDDYDQLYQTNTHAHECSRYFNVIFQHG